MLVHQRVRLLILPARDGRGHPFSLSLEAHFIAFVLDFEPFLKALRQRCKSMQKCQKLQQKRRKTTKRNVKHPRVDTPTKKRAPQLYTLGTLGFQGASPFSCSVWFFGTLDVPGQRVITVLAKVCSTTARSSNSFSEASSADTAQSGLIQGTKSI